MSTVYKVTVSIKDVRGNEIEMSGTFESINSAESAKYLIQNSIEHKIGYEHTVSISSRSEQVISKTTIK